MVWAVPQVIGNRYRRGSPASPGPAVTTVGATAKVIGGQRRASAAALPQSCAPSAPAPRSRLPISWRAILLAATTCGYLRAFIPLMWRGVWWGGGPTQTRNQGFFLI